ncbi:MAG: transcription elongation factor GreA [Bdellovibrionales bacterium GWA2_49_15]|nr:MAG: transcription elongation factor GreA [Bdellovibrionales bacterium GWA2_49_15]
MAERELMTVQGKRQIEQELSQLIKVEREDLKRTIAEARALGDLKENAEYHSAKEKQSMIEGRIAQLQDIIARAEIIDPSTLRSTNIIFGASVKLFDTEKDIEVLYQIVGKTEADLKNGKIFYLSPLGKALLGKEKGDTVTVQAPKGVIEYEVIDVFFK